ncbi:MAG: hypothetical protein ABI036_16095 [Fibrobacteria bacterium]
MVLTILAVWSEEVLIRPMASLILLIAVRLFSTDSRVALTITLACLALSLICLVGAK